MKSNQIHSTEKEINYENIPTQLSDKSKERNSQKIYKEKKINLKNSDNTNNFIDIKKFKRNTIDAINNNENKINKKHSIKKNYKTKKSQDNNTNINIIAHNKKNLNNSLRKRRRSIDNNNNNIIKKDDDFLTRQAKYSAKKISNIKKLQKEIALNYFPKKSHQDCFNSRSTRNINNISFISGLSCSKSMAEIESSISKLYEWDKRRKEKK